jgi:hypothetical protein
MIIKNGEIFGISIKKNTNRQSKIIVKNGDITGLIGFEKTPVIAPSGYANTIIGVNISSIINVATANVSNVIGV